MHFKTKEDSVVSSVSYFEPRAKKRCLDKVLKEMSHTEETMEKHSTKRVQHTFHTMDLRHSPEISLLVLSQYK